jgi:hypothetical protein
MYNLFCNACDYDGFVEIISTHSTVPNYLEQGSSYRLSEGIRFYYNSSL